HTLSTSESFITSRTVWYTATTKVMAFHSLPAAAAAALQYVNRGSVGAFCFLLYDILLTFDDEVDLFWRKKWTFMKFNFFFVRYFPLLAQMRDCKTWLASLLYILLTIISKFIQRLVSFSLILEIIGVPVRIDIAQVHRGNPCGLG
ncbi:hypothetical protein MPER_06803, partial [Moniliophthora perniciosa FA553]